jgi:hypothetical protein|tara:strand:- start:870 stop:1460 length:591 start_codon:yes stop_codon:yes gene_type:complete
MSKLKNIKAVKEMLTGEHKTQTKKTISFNGKVVERKEVGETWTDDKGQKWEQRKGYKVKVGKLSKLREELKSFPNCNKETCTCIEPGQADLKMKAIHGMCLNCVVEMEHNLKMSGEYEEYERKKLLANAEAWLKQAELEKEVLKTTLKASFVNEDGSIEEWAEGMSEKELEEKIDKDFETFRKNFIGKLKNEQTTD